MTAYISCAFAVLAALSGGVSAYYSKEASQIDAHPLWVRGLPDDVLFEPPDPVASLNGQIAGFQTALQAASQCSRTAARWGMAAAILAVLTAVMGALQW